jgi:hyperosmotically inducible periplasmic protein
VKAKAKVRGGAVLVAGIMATVMLSGCAMAMLGGAARSGGSGTSASGSASGSSSTSGRASSSSGAGTATVSDGSISTAVRSRLGANSALKTLKIVVDTHDGIVTLKGQVNTLADKSAAQAEARAVTGVKGVNNQLTVR